MLVGKGQKVSHPPALNKAPGERGAADMEAGLPPRASASEWSVWECVGEEPRYHGRSSHPHGCFLAPPVSPSPSHQSHSGPKCPPGPCPGLRGRHKSPGLHGSRESPERPSLGYLPVEGEGIFTPVRAPPHPCFQCPG